MFRINFYLVEFSSEKYTSFGEDSKFGLKIDDSDY